MKKRPTKGKVEKRKLDNEWTAILIGMIIPVTITLVFRFGLFPNTVVDSWASAVLLASVVLFFVGRYTPMKSIDVALVAIINLCIIVCYLLYYIFGYFIL